MNGTIDSPEVTVGETIVALQGREYNFAPTDAIHDAWAPQGADYDYATNSCSGLCKDYLQVTFLLLPPATKLGQGNIFRSVCQEFCSQRGGLPHCMLDTHRGNGGKPKPPWQGSHPWQRSPPRQGRQPGQGDPLIKTLIKIKTPRQGDPLGKETLLEIWPTSGRYASYWDAYL